MTSHSKFVFRPLDQIGDVSAERDQKFLHECFVDTGIIDVLCDPNDSRAILVGRTGAGKTALIETIRRREERHFRIDPHELALQYLLDSSVLETLISANVGLERLYRFLWKHIFIVELLRLRYPDDTGKNVFARLKDMVRSQREREAIEYLEKRSTSFIDHTETHARDLVKTVEEEFTARASAGLMRSIEAGLDGRLRLTTEQRSEVQQIAREALNSVQIQELTRVEGVINHCLSQDRQKNYFILLDQLEENWVDDSTRYRIVRSALDVAADMNGNLDNAKIIIAIRTDLLERVLAFATDSGMQSEKVWSLSIPVEWQKEDLKTVVDYRVGALVRSRYTKAVVTSDQVFRGQVGREKEDPMKFILRRTLDRPRDAIAFVNLCIEASVGRDVVPAQIVEQSERAYSVRRLSALEEEWSADYPLLPDIWDLMRGRQTPFSIGEIDEGVLVEFALRCFDRAEVLTTIDAKVVQQLVRSSPNFDTARFDLVRILYRVGAVGVRIQSYEPYSWLKSGRAELGRREVQLDSKLDVHPMLRAGLNVSGHRVSK